eukprot:GILJ01023603.1.p2 GENE.GILJ01023603.1~~GILJ01023603.1.p2  ORF type:complete len:129 (-),score=2.20 GILJ01023603.1:289-675(-)
MCVACICCSVCGSKLRLYHVSMLYFAASACIRLCVCCVYAFCECCQFVFLHMQQYQSRHRDNHEELCPERKINCTYDAIKVVLSRSNANSCISICNRAISLKFDVPSAASLFEESKKHPTTSTVPLLS